MARSNPTVRSRSLRSPTEAALPARWRVEQAQSNGDPYSYFLVLRDLGLAFNDGHVSFNGGEYERLYNENNLLGGWGFSVEELEDGRVITVFVLADGPADQAGMQVGAEIVSIGGEPIRSALEHVAPYQPQSTDFGLRNEQVVFLTRGGIDETLSVAFKNPGGNTQAVNLVSIYELESLFAVFQGGTRDEYALPPGWQVDIDPVHLL